MREVIYIGMEIEWLHVDKERWKHFLKYSESLAYLSSVGTFYTVIFTLRSKQLIEHIDK